MMRVTQLTNPWIFICMVVLLAITLTSCGQDEPPVTVVPDRPADPVVEVDDEFLGNMRG